MTKTTIQWLKEYLETKILPCPEGNDYVYGMNVAHTCLIEYMIPYLLEKEKNQIVEAYDRGYKACDLDEALEINKTMFSGEGYYEQTYKPKTI
jgi:hypothetical protein